MKFKVGEVYKDRTGREYTFLVYAPKAHASSQLIFIDSTHGIVHSRFTDGTVDRGAKTPIDILPPEKKTRKLYPVLYKTASGKFYPSYLHDECPEDAIRLITEWPPVIVEVEE